MLYRIDIGVVDAVHLVSFGHCHRDRPHRRGVVVSRPARCSAMPAFRAQPIPCWS
jgi:hypothetical protein